MAAVLPDPGAQDLVQPDYNPSDVTVTIPLSVLGLIGGGPYASDPTGQTALHWAAENGCLPLVLHLIKKAGHAGADLVARTDHQGQNPLHLAAAAGHAGLIPHLITPTTLDAADGNNQTALQLAVQHKQLEAATALVAAGASLGQAETAAHTVCCAIRDVERGSSPQLALLLVNAMLAGPGAAVRVAQSLQWPRGSLRIALHIAAEIGSQELVAKLLEAGADRDAVDSHGFTPLGTAAQAGHAHLVPLLATPTDVKPVATGRLVCGRPLFLAAQAGKHKAVAALLAAGAQAHACDSIGTSALAVAAEGGHTSTMLVLLEAMVRERRQQQQGQEWLVSHVAAAALSVLRPFADVDPCCKLLEVVLDVLGLEGAREVCQAVQQQLQEAIGSTQQQAAAGGTQAGPRNMHVHQFSQLAEALLVSWVGVAEPLHAARQPLVARLQRLVPGVEDRRPEQQQQQQEGIKEKPDVRLVQLVADAESAAAAGQEQRAQVHLQEFAALFHQHQQEVGSRCADAHSNSSEIQGAFGKSPSSMFIVAGLYRASIGRRMPALISHSKSGGTSAPHSTAPLWQAQALHPPAVYTTFLAAWVGARRQLQQLPQERAAAVVAAVKAAREQQAQQDQHEQQKAVEQEAAGQEPELLSPPQAPPPYPHSFKGSPEQQEQRQGSGGWCMPWSKFKLLVLGVALLMVWAAVLLAR